MKSAVKKQTKAKPQAKPVPKPEFSVDQLRELANTVLREPELINNLSADETAALRQHLNPMASRILDEDVSYINISLTNWADTYMRKFYTTSLTGFMYRAASEYEPLDELEALDAQHQKIHDKLRIDISEGLATLDEQNLASKRHQAARAELLKSSRSAVTAFLDSLFKYNPDVHARSAGKTTSKVLPSDRAASMQVARSTAGTAKHVENVLSTKPDASYGFLRNNMLGAYQESKAALDTITAAQKLMNPDTDEYIMLTKRKSKLAATVAEMSKIATPLAAADTLAAATVLPPADLGHSIERYISGHYEQLREATEAIYADRPDIEYSIIYYGTFDSPEAARDHRIQHESELKTEVYTIESGSICLLGPFKENRDRVDFYNKNTEVLKQMMEQLESDHKLGKDLMEKRVRKQKAKNIATDGPDAPGLANYAKTASDLQKLSAKRVLSPEEKEQMRVAAEAAAAAEDAETPKNALDIDMYYTDASGDMQRERMYTEAVKPTEGDDVETAITST